MLEIAVIYLAAAIIAVPIAKRLGLGSVLGYLLAGVFIGPFVLGVVGDQTEVMHFAEFGVVMMLFLVGLELQPSRLWKLRHSIIGLGGLQVLMTAALIMAVCYWTFSLKWQTSLAIGFMLALSSTAIVLQTLAEKGWIKQDGGQNAFSVLLFQDIAVIPILALLPLLAFQDTTLIAGATSQNHNLIEAFPAWAQASIALSVIALIIVAGKYISAPVFRYIADTRLSEVFTIFALFLVISIALVMQKIGLSPALGTFLAGVVLAESDFRHELEADIEPFKGLLLGLFFITVGASIDFAFLLDTFALVITLVAALVIIKAAVLFCLAHIFKMQSTQKLLFSLALAQGGEFAFVLVSVTGNLQILNTEQVKLVTLVVAISMLLAPLLLLAYEKYVTGINEATRDYDSAEDIASTKNVIVAGYGRFGQVIGRLLRAQGYHLSILDHSPSQVDLVRKFGDQAFYGDAARKNLLEAAGAKDAQLLVIAVDEPDKTLEIIELAQKHYPHLKIVTRAIDRRHAYQIRQLGVTACKRETFDSSISLGVEALKLLGESTENATRAGEIFRQHDENALISLAEVWGDDHVYGAAVKQSMQDLIQVLNQDKALLNYKNSAEATGDLDNA